MKRHLKLLFRLHMLWRYACILLWEFRWSLLVFWGLVFGVGFILFRFYHHHPLSFGDACYAVFLMIFMESYLEFPEEWFLQPLFFLVPIVGLGAVADSLVRLGFLVFSRKQRLPEWHRMIASMYKDHYIVLGLGKVGYQIAKGFIALRLPVVVIERTHAESTLIDELIEHNVPVIRGDGRTLKTLREAGIARARSFLATTSDDLTNLDAGLTARDLNPAAHVVLRLFDESLAAKVRGAFTMPAISTAQVAAPAFIAAATGRRVYQSFKFEDQVLHLIDMTIQPGGKLANKRLSEIQGDNIANVVLHRAAATGHVLANPQNDTILRPNDQILVIAPIDRLLELEATNHDIGTPTVEEYADPPPFQPPPSLADLPPVPAPGEAKHPATCDFDQ